MTLLRASISLGFFVGCLAVGWWLNRRGFLNQPRASRLVEFVVKRLAPLVLCLVLWRIDVGIGRLWLLPFIGVLVASAMALPAWLYAKRARLTPPQTGSMLTCAFFSNLGFLGAFIAFVLFGEEAYGLCILYLLFFVPCFYTLGFGIASRYGRREERNMSQPALSDELRWYPFVGMVVGILLAFLGVPRPEILSPINQVLIPTETALYLTAIGSQITFAPITRWLKASMAMSAIKFLYGPAIGWLLINAFAVEGLPRFIVLLEASMPVAVSPLVLPLLFGLDRDLSSALWFFTTLLAIPWLLLIIPVLQVL